MTSRHKAPRWFAVSLLAAASFSFVWSLVRLSAAEAPAGRYLVGTGTIYDTKTTRTWQQASAPGTYTVAQAKAACSGLSLSGGGWRLPSRNELVTLVDVSRPVEPAIDPAFLDTSAEFYWTATPDAANGGYSHVVSFKDGTAGGYPDLSARRVRCVR